MKDKAIIKWSKKENDYVVKYPDRNGRIFGNVIFGMLQDFEKARGMSFREHLKNSGYDADTFTVTIKKSIHD